MDTFITAYLSGVISIIAIGIFIWTVRRGKSSVAGSIKERVDRNNTDTRSGLDKLTELNNETARLNKTAAGIERSGLKAIDNTNRTVSKIIAAAKRNSKKESDK